MQAERTSWSLPDRGSAFLFLLLLCCGASVQAEAYRWVDENGKVHFGDRPPRGVEKESIKLPESKSSTPVPSAAERRDKTRRLLEAWEEERRIEKEQEAKAAAEKAERRKRCHRAKNELRDLQAGGLFYDLDEDGNRHYLSDAELMQEQEHWRKAIQRWCD